MKFMLGDKVRVTSKNEPDQFGRVVDLKWNMVKVSLPQEHVWIDSKNVSFDTTPTPFKESESRNET